MIIRTSWCLALVASLAACNKDKDKAKAADPDKGASATATASDSKTATPAASTVDAKIVDAATKVGSTCKLTDDGYYEYNCPARQAWNDVLRDKLGPLMSSDATYAATFVKILEDKNPGVQGLAASSMYDKQDWLATDKALQERVLVVAAALPKDSKGTANRIGRVIGFFHFDKTGLFDKAKAIVDNAEAPEALRVGIVNWVLAGNQDSEPAYNLVRDQAQKGSPAIQAAALVGLSAAYNKRPTDEMCKLWRDALPTLANDPASLIAAHLTNGDLQVFNENEAFPYNWAMISSKENKCPADAVDAALEFVDKQVTAGKATGLGTWWIASLAGPSKSKNASDAQKAKAVEIAKKYADNPKYEGYLRGSAIELLVDADPAAAKALADKYATDKDSSLKSATERVLKKLAGTK